MDNDSMIVTLTLGQLKEVVGAVVKTELESVLAESNNLRTLDDVCVAYGVGKNTAMQWRRELIALGIAKHYGKSWCVAKSEMDRWLQTRN